MRGQAHLIKRGNVWQWRRKLRLRHLRSLEIRLSLGTTDPHTAIVLARKLTAESEDVMNQIQNGNLTSDEARKWLADAVRKERDKIDRLKMLRLVDSMNPADDLRHDELMRAAWSHVAREGLNAQAPEMDASLQRHIELIRADLLSEARKGIIAREFREMSGRDTVSAGQLVTLMTLLVAAKNAAWSRHDEALSDMVKLADQLSAQHGGLFGVEPEAPAATHAEVITSNEPEAPNPVSSVPAEQVTMAPLPQAGSPSESDDPDFDPTIAAVVSRMNEFKRREGVEEKTLRQYESFATLFTLLTGVSDVRLIRQRHASEFRAALQKLPKSWGKSPADRTATKTEIMARAATLPPEKVGLAIGTVNRHLEHLSQVTEWAADEGFAVDDALKPNKLRRKDTVRASEKRDAFTVPQLESLFQSAIWTGSHSERSQTTPGPTIYKNGLYWSPIIAAFTGARLEEIAGLAPSDIVEVDGVMCFSIDDSELRRVKNLASRRIVPIHPRLIELGFLEHVSTARKTKTVRLFPELLQPASGKHGKKITRRMREIVDEVIGEAGAKCSFHSFRHYVQNYLENAGFSERIVRNIVGHEGKDSHERNYSKRPPMDLLVEAIHKLPTPI